MTVPELTSRVALVTGAGRGIGRAIAVRLAQCGACVAVADIAQPDATVDAIRSGGGRASAHQVDLADRTTRADLVPGVISEHGRLDILVNNAAWNIGIRFPDLDALSADIWDRVQETNLRGPYLLARACAAHLRAHKAGRIVNIASVAGRTPTGSSIAYAVSKAGLVHLTHCLAVAMAPDIAVNCIAPGLVEGTQMAQRLPEEIAEKTRRQAVLGRTASAQDIAAQAVLFCQADSISGQVIAIDGGMLGSMH